MYFFFFFFFVAVNIDIGKTEKGGKKRCLWIFLVAWKLLLKPPHCSKFSLYYRCIFFFFFFLCLSLDIILVKQVYRISFPRRYRTLNNLYTIKLSYTYILIFYIITISNTWIRIIYVCECLYVIITKVFVCFLAVVLLDTTQESLLEWTRYPFGPNSPTPGVSTDRQTHLSSYSFILLSFH